MSTPEIPEYSPQNHVGDHVYYTGDHIDASVSGGILHYDQPPKQWLRPDTGKGEEAHHLTRVFSDSETARLAAEADILPAADRADKQLLRTVIDLAISNPADNSSLAESMAGESIARRLEPASLHQLGLRTAEELNGSPDKPGSNFWIVEHMLQTRTDNTSNSLALTALLTDERASLSPGQITMTLEKFHEQNRLALDALYEAYNVDFSNARIYKSIRLMDANNEIYCTVYPIADSDYYFTEMTGNRRGTPRTPGQPPERLAAHINYGHPQLAYEIGDNWRPADGARS